MTIEAIWHEYRAALNRFLHSRVSNTSDVEDLLQEILLKSYKNLHNIKSQDSIKSWVFQIANNVIIDHYRNKGKVKDLDAKDLWYEEESVDVKQELSECITPFINALPVDSAQLLTAIDLNNVKQKDYAATNGLSYSTLKSRVQKGRSQLRGLFEDCCHLSLDKHGNIIEYQPKGDSCGKCP